MNVQVHVHVCTCIIILLFILIVVQISRKAKRCFDCAKTKGNVKWLKQNGLFLWLFYVKFKKKVYNVWALLLSKAVPLHCTCTAMP